MIYREHAYSVVQTAHSRAWRWTVQLRGSGSKTGESHRRESAIGAAFAVIDTLIEAALPAGAVAHAAVSHEIIDGRMVPKSSG